MFDDCEGVDIVLDWDVYCLFGGGFLTSSGLFEAGLLRFFSAVGFWPNCFVTLGLIWSTGSVPVILPPLSVFLSFVVVLLKFTNFPIFCCVSCEYTELLRCPVISHKKLSCVFTRFFVILRYWVVVSTSQVRVLFMLALIITHFVLF